MSSRVDQVVEEVGSAICHGTLGEGEPITAEQVQERSGTSRSGVREALGILVTLGLLRVRRRIGYEVCGPASWQLLAPEVMRWRLTGPDAGAVVAELTALRELVEPAAAVAACRAASADERATIVDAAAALWSAAVRGERAAFVTADVAMHAAVLAASGNSLYRALGGVLAEALPERLPDDGGISLDRAREHRDLADAIATGAVDDAARLARVIALAPHD